MKNTWSRRLIFRQQHLSSRKSNVRRYVKLKKYPVHQKNFQKKFLEGGNLTFSATSSRNQVARKNHCFRQKLLSLCLRLRRRWDVLTSRDFSSGLWLSCWVLMKMGLLAGICSELVENVVIFGEHSIASQDKYRILFLQA